MTMIRQITSATERQAVAKAAYEMKLKQGLDDPTIAEELQIEVWQATSLRQWYESEFAETPQENAARQLAIARTEHDLNEMSVWQERLHAMYLAGRIDIEKAGNLAARLVKTRTELGIRYSKLLGLDSPVNVNVTTSSPVDQAIMDLYAEHTASAEVDAPLE